MLNPMLKYIYRRIGEINSQLCLQDIWYCFTDEGKVDILKINTHDIDEYGLVGENQTDLIELTHVVKLFALDMLIQDGIVDFS